MSGSYVDPERTRTIREDAKRITTPFVVTDKWGYAPVGAEGEPELYDLPADPLAQNNVAGDNPSEIPAAHQALLEHLRQHGASDSLIGLWEKP